MPAFSYATPLNAAVTSGTTPSMFPTILGTTASGGSGIVGTLYGAVSQVKSVLSGIATNAGSFSNNSASFSGAISGAQSNLDNFVSIIQSGDSTIGSALKLTKTPSTLMTMGIQVFYGVIIGFCVLTLLGVLLMTFCDKYRCRHLMYFSCIFLFLIGMIGFLISGLFSVFVPVLYLGCDFLTTSFSSSANFQSKFLLIQPISEGLSLMQLQ